VFVSVATGTCLPSRCPETTLLYPPISRSLQYDQRTGDFAGHMGLPSLKMTVAYFNSALDFEHTNGIQWILGLLNIHQGHFLQKYLCVFLFSAILARQTQFFSLRNVLNYYRFTFSVGYLLIFFYYPDHIVSGDGMRDEWKGLGRKRSWPNRDTILEFVWRHWEKPQSVYPVPQPRFERNTSRIRV
jgi:hypothetical protein